jgi:hypothetical protein
MVGRTPPGNGRPSWEGAFFKGFPGFDGGFVENFFLVLAYSRKYLESFSTRRWRLRIR